MNTFHAAAAAPERTSGRWSGPLRLMIALAALCVVAGCANLQTIGRSTDFSQSEGAAKAVHLDAQQRLVIMTGEKYCAEPSPDALASYASALGFGLTGANRNSASAAAALQSNAGSLGLRTQSITLMRDALYRMCEAQANKAISASDAATFLTRSQDLIAVVLAIEQLTGAVAASPVVLTGGGSASSSALLLSNQQMLEQARQNEAAAKKALDAAVAADAEAQALVIEKASALKAARDHETTVANSATATPAEKAEAKAAADALEPGVAEANANAQSAAGKLTAAKQALADATENREAIEAQRDSSLTTASANVYGSGQVGVVSQRPPLSAAATKEVAQAVSGMVAAVLKKTYTTENCMAFLTNSVGGTRIDTISRDSLRTLVEACIGVISAELAARTAELGLQATRNNEAKRELAE